MADFFWVFTGTKYFGRFQGVPMILVEFGGVVSGISVNSGDTKQFGRFLGVTSILAKPSKMMPHFAIPSPRAK